MEVYDFGERLRRLREKRRFSQVDVADRIGIKAATVSGYERNVTTPSLDILRRLALTFNVSTDYLLGLTDREEIYLDDLLDESKAAAMRLLDDLREIIHTETQKKNSEDK